MERQDARYLQLCNAVLYCPPNERLWGPGVRDVFVLHYVTEGSGYLECGGKRHRITKGQTFAILPDVLVHYMPDPNDPWNYVWVDFSGPYAAQLMASTGFSPKSPVCDALDESPEALFLQAGRQFRCECPADMCRNEYNLHRILTYYTEHFPNRRKRDPDTLLTAALGYIERNYRRTDLSVASIAQALHTGRVSLYRCFARTLRTSPNDYIARFRISKARELLMRQDVSVKAAAYSVGFSDQLYFSKVFKKLAGMTPSAFRKLHGDTDE